MKQQEVSLESITIQGTVRQIIKNWWVVLCLALAVFLGSTGLGMLTYTPQYTTSSTLVIRAKGADAYSTLAQSTQMAAVYSEIFQSDALRKKISQSIGEEVKGSISCSQIEQTNLLELKVTSPTPRQAYLFIHSALENYEQVAQYVFTNASLEILQKPSVPEEPSNTSFFIARRIELTILAALVAVVLIVVIYMLRNTVKAASKAQSLLDGKILGIVPYEKKQAAGEGLTKRKKNVQALPITSPLVSMRFAEASRRAAARLEAHLRHKKYQTLLVASVEENEGKSTVAANIAIALAERGKRVALIDGDFRKSAQYKIFDRRNVKAPSFSDAAAGELSWKEVARQNEKGHFVELFQYKNIKNPDVLLNSKHLPNLMEELRDNMDYIVIDCPPVAAAADAELWMRYADTVALVVRQDRADVCVINDTVDLIWKSAGDFSGFILNAFQNESMGRDDHGRYGEY